jgi:hypothetical protein
VPLTSTIKPVPCVAPPTMVVPLHAVRKPCAPSSTGHPLILQRAGSDKPAMPQDRKPKSILSTVQGSKFGNSRTGHNDIPDLLSGFDKHAASLMEQKEKYVSISVPLNQTSSDNTARVQASEHPLFVGPIGESPYITSKSFDDLHQCLANNQIPHLDLSIGHTVQQDEQKMCVPVPPVACGVPIQVSTNNCPSAFTPYTNQHQQNYTQPMHMVSFMPQIQTQLAKQPIPAQQVQNVTSFPMVQSYLLVNHLVRYLSTTKMGLIRHSQIMLLLLLLLWEEVEQTSEATLNLDLHSTRCSMMEQSGSSQAIQ